MIFRLLSPGELATTLCVPDFKLLALVGLLPHCVAEGLAHFDDKPEHRLHLAGGEDGREQGAHPLPLLPAQVRQLSAPQLPSQE